MELLQGRTTAVPLDAALPWEDLVELINRSDSAALFLSPKHRPYLQAFLENCPKVFKKRWMLQEGVEDAPEKDTVPVNFGMQEIMRLQMLSVRIKRILRQLFLLQEQLEKVKELC